MPVIPIGIEEYQQELELRPDAVSFHILVEPDFPGRREQMKPTRTVTSGFSECCQHVRLDRHSLLQDV